MHWRYWQGSGLAIHRSQVRVLARHHCVVALDKLITPVCLTKQYDLVLDKGVMSLFGKVTVSMVESIIVGYHLVYGYVTCRLTAKKPG